MIEIGQGNLLNSKTDAQVNAVNCVGVMGRGIALQFRNAFPDNYQKYRIACSHGVVVPGKMFVHDNGPLAMPRYIINFPTKLHWKSESKMEYIDTGLLDLVAVIKELQIKSVAIPALGCGLGGLDWQLVRPRIAGLFETLPGVKVLIFEPSNG